MVNSFSDMQIHRLEELQNDFLWKIVCKMFDRMDWLRQIIILCNVNVIYTMPHSGPLCNNIILHLTFPTEQMV